MGKAEFDNAVARVKTLKKAPPNDILLRLYGLFKQATVGDVTGKRPGRLDFRNRAKYDAWSKRKGMSQAEAQDAYVSLVSEVMAKANAGAL